MNHSTLPFDHKVQNNLHRLRFTADPGLYRLTIDADAAAFDWPSLYLTLNLFGNVNQPSGPWDFNLLDNHKPLLPAYWVHLDGRKLGLAYFNRPSAAQVRTKRFKGEFGFQIHQSGPHELLFEPYHPFALDWDLVHLAPEWQDRFDFPSLTLADPAADLLPPALPQNQFTPYFLNSLDWAKSDFPFDRWGVGGLQLPILLAAHHWLHDSVALQTLSAHLERYLALPAWGNPKADGYGHNGDMSAAKLLSGLSFCLRFLPHELRSLRSPLLEKIKHHGNLFLEQTLLHCGYWGGAILQDHGYSSAAHFATAAYLCQGLLDDAHHWLAFAWARLQRTLAALPTDGVIAATNYHTLATYVDVLVLFRHLHLQATGIDIYQSPAFRALPAASRALAVTPVNTHPLPDFAGFTHYEFGFGQLAHPCPLGDLMPYDGAMAFFAQIAADPDAQWFLQDILLRHTQPQTLYPFYHGHLAVNWLWALLFFNPPKSSQTLSTTEITSDSTAPSAAPSLHWFKDSGVAALRTARTLIVTKCGPPTSHTGYRNSTNCTDRMFFAPLAGNFVLLHQGQKILHGTNSRYGIYTHHGNVLMVDDMGQRDDLGMPMAQPDPPYYGEKILGLPDSHTVEMDLTPAYEHLTSYRRLLSLDPDDTFTLRDLVTADSPRRFTWLFHSYQRNPWTCTAPGRWTLSVYDSRYDLELHLDDHDFTVELRPTPAVWSFPGNDAERCHHLALSPRQPLAHASLTLRLLPKRP